jgi:hypothetical protein
MSGVFPELSGRGKENQGRREVHWDGAFLQIAPARSPESHFVKNAIAARL